MKKFISCARFGKKYYMIILIILIVGTYFGYMYTYIWFLKDKPKYVEGYKENLLLLSLLKYLGCTLFGIGDLIQKKINFKNEEKSEKVTSLNFRDKLYILLISFFVLIAEFLAVVIRQLNGKNIIYIDEYYNIIEFIFLLLTSKFIYKTRYYKHQYISVIIIFIFEIVRYIIKFEEYFNFDNFFLVYFLQMIRALVDSIFVGYSKGLMNSKFFSPYKVTFIFGFIDLIMISIIYLIISLIPVNEDSPLCFNKYNDKCYIDNFKSIFEGFSFIQFICLFFHTIFVGLGRFLLNYILNNYSTCHLIVYYNFCEFYTNCNNPHDQKIFLIISSVLEFFIIFVFLEIIELNCFGISENTQDNIERRAILDSIDDLKRDSMPHDITDQYEVFDTLDSEKDKRETNDNISN